MGKAVTLNVVQALYNYNTKSAGKRKYIKLTDFNLVFDSIDTVNFDEH
jgi:hypothetical protein